MPLKTANAQPQEPQPVKLGIWGAANSGKTVYMTMLYHYLATSRSPWRVVTTDSATQEFVNDNVELIVNKGRFVPPTDIRDDAYDMYSYKLVNKKDGRIIELNFMDFSGELFVERINNKIIVENEEALTVSQYLNRCHGILFLVSPLKEDRPKNYYYFSLLQKLFTEMQRENFNSNPNNLGKLEQYVAFGITKIDHPEVYEGFLRPRPPEKSPQPPDRSMLELLGRNTSLNWFDNFFHIEIDSRGNAVDDQPTKSNRCHFFYISPFGVNTEEGKLKSPVYKVEDNTDSEEDMGSESQSSTFLNKSQPSPSAENPYAGFEEGISASNRDNGDKQLYRINTDAEFRPYNILSPIQWLIRGIDGYYPSVCKPPDKEKEQQ